MKVLAAVFPGICTLCKRRSRRFIDLCHECEAALEINDRACPVCAGSAPPASSGDAICGACLVAPPPWTLTVAPFIYSPPMSGLIEGLKSGNGLKQARILGALLVPAIHARYASGSLPEALVAVPLTRKRQRRRGFNQAELLATLLGRTLDLPRVNGRLMRIRDAPPQRALSRSARLRNVRGAYAVRESGRSKALPKRVALVDDVSTTGATVRAATDALRAAGVDEVHVWVAAKTPAAPRPSAMP